MDWLDIVFPVVSALVGAGGAVWFLRREPRAAEVESEEGNGKPLPVLPTAQLEFISETPVPEASNPIGFRVRHANAHSCVVIVPVAHKPFRRGPKTCPTCNVKHEVKTLHLSLDENGEAVVSHGVLADLKGAGMPFFEEVGHVEGPPPLVIRPGMSRQQIDKENRAITVRNYIHG